MDYKWLKEAVDVSKLVAEQVNESNRQQENVAIVADIEKRVEDWRVQQV